MGTWFRDKRRRPRRLTDAHRVGFVFQQFNLLPGISVLDNVALPLLLRGIGSRERRERARRVIELLSLTDKIGTKARQLSVGQQQRVAIGRALVTGAGVLLCDEPTASLDGATGRGVLDTLQTLVRLRRPSRGDRDAR